MAEPITKERLAEIAYNSEHGLSTHDEAVDAVEELIAAVRALQAEIARKDAALMAIIERDNWGFSPTSFSDIARAALSPVQETRDVHDYGAATAGDIAFGIRALKEKQP